MTDRELMQQALEAVDWLRHHLTQHHGCLHMDATASGIPAWLDKTETALRERLTQPEQEPVALETVYETIIHWDEGGGKRSRRELARRIIALYTAPTPRKPLTEPELHAITPTWPAPGQEWDYEEVLAFVRAIERAHGITGETK